MPELEMEASFPSDREASFPARQSVELQPIAHQVSGHTCMLRYNETTLCKIFITREHHFYTHFSSEMREFTPKYKGTIEVQWLEDHDGYITLVGLTPEVHRGTDYRTAESYDTSGNHGHHDQQPWKTPSPDSYSARLLRSGSIEVSATTSHKMYDTKDPKTMNVDTDSVNPWSLRCHKKQLTMMKKKGQDTSKFMLLENVVSKYVYPCILDLKMGTRQHGDDSTEAKKQRFMQKCQSSTSAELGTRLCGMQVFQESTGKYICYNKYHGRSLSVDQFKQALQQFLHNGYHLRTELLQRIVKKLLKLQHVIENHETFRFYSCSLLVLYEGYEGKEAKVADVSSTSPGQSSGTDSEASSESWDKLFEKHEMTSRSDAHHDLKSDDCDFVADAKVDVRIIDFAHATYDGFPGDKQKHSGPDTGYLLGVENLIRLFHEIQHSDHS